MSIELILTNLKLSVTVTGIPALTLETKPLHQTMDSLPMKDAYKGTHSDRSFVESLADSSMSNKEQVNDTAKK